MRKMKKLASLLLALVMVLSLSVTAMADEPTTYTITINNSTEGYEYTAYQIFKGDLLVTTTTDADSGETTTTTTLSNVEFGSALSATDQTALLAYYATTLGTDYESSAAGLAAALAEGKITAAAFAAQVATYALTSAGTSTYNKNTSDPDASNYTVNVTGAGYYLVKNTNVPDEDGAYTSYILSVVADVAVEAKADIPSSDKTVGDVNDSDNTTAQGDTDSADYDIGDSVPFTLTATLPTNYGDYTTYQLTFHDTLSSGLSFNNNVVVKVGTTVVAPSCYTVATGSDLTDTCSFEVQISNTKALTDADGNAISLSAGDTITVEYTATLETGASFKETNKMHIEYSNNPNDGSSGETGNTPDDTTTVFTFTLTVNKVDAKKNPLKGAGFTLYKYDADTQAYVAVGSEVKGTDLTSFTWKGLDDGQYKLKETTTPAGYNTMDDVEFYIVATHTEDGLTSLKVTSDAAGTTEIDGYTESLTDGTITADIVNYSGSILPSTGGIGTTIFYVVGTLLVLGAAVVLITRKRMSREV
ncbi:MAG: isopeptide-forming domain-containing fimbrial protein [Lachnospiraceae bacterium]|nr:isopeptide-forming domain-containing fimbrial protein [Lachnospiraceae bacterium]